MKRSEFVVFVEAVNAAAVANNADDNVLRPIFDDPECRHEAGAVTNPNGVSLTRFFEAVDEFAADPVRTHEYGALFAPEA